MTNRTVGILIAALCVPLWQVAGTFPGMAATFPKTVLALIGGLAILLAAMSFVPVAGVHAAGEGSAEPVALIRPLLVGACAGVAVMAMPIVGFFPAMAVLGAVLLVVLGVVERLTYAAVVAGGLVFIYAVFVHILGVPLEASRILGR